MSNRADTFTALGGQELIYSDFLMDLTPHPVTGDVVRVSNERAIVNAMRNLILTDVGERLFQPQVGSKLRSLLFEQMTSGIEIAMEQQVAEMLKAFEPRAKVAKVRAEADEEENGFRLTITFYIINRSDPVSFNVTLSRVR